METTYRMLTPQGVVKIINAIEIPALIAKNEITPDSTFFDNEKKSWISFKNYKKLHVILSTFSSTQSEPEDVYRVITDEGCHELSMYRIERLVKKGIITPKTAIFNKEINCWTSLKEYTALYETLFLENINPLQQEHKNPPRSDFLQKCLNCHQLYSKRADKCPKCGDVINVACNICLRKIPQNSTNCPECGDPTPFDQQVAITTRTLKSDVFPNQKQYGLCDKQTGNEYRFKPPPRILINFTLFFLWVLVIVILIEIFFEARQIILLENISTITIEDFETNDKRISLIGTVQIFIMIITSVVFFVWQYRTSRNCHSFNAQGMRFTPGWAVGWNLVPFMNLFRPYQVMQEIWKVSTDPSAWRNKPASALIKWWWFCVLAGSFIGGFTFKFAIGSYQTNPSITDLVILTYVSIINNSVYMAGWFVTIWLVVAIRDKQDRLIREIREL